MISASLVSFFCLWLGTLLSSYVEFLNMNLLYRFFRWYQRSRNNLWFCCCCCWVSVCIRYCGELLLPIISENQTEKNYFGTRIFSTVFLFRRWSLMLLLYLLVWTLHFYTLFTREIIIIIIIAETKPHRTKNRYKQEEWNVTMTWFFIHWQLAFQSIFLSPLVNEKYYSGVLCPLLRIWVCVLVRSLACYKFVFSVPLGVCRGRAYRLLF